MVAPFLVQGLDRPHAFDFARSWAGGLGGFGQARFCRRGPHALAQAVMARIAQAIRAHQRTLETWPRRAPKRPPSNPTWMLTGQEGAPFEGSLPKLRRSSSQGLSFRFSKTALLVRVQRLVGLLCARIKPGQSCSMKGGCHVIACSTCSRRGGGSEVTLPSKPSKAKVRAVTKVNPIRPRYTNAER